MNRSADRARWIESAWRHPAAVAAALFCGGLATGTWLGRARTRGRGGELEPRLGDARASDPPVARAAPDTGTVPVPAPTRTQAAPGLARLRNPIGSPSVLQR